MRADPEWCRLLEDLRDGRVELEDVEDIRWRQDRDLVFAAVEADGSALEFAGEALQDEKELVLLAVSESGAALRHASARLRADREVVLRAVQGFGLALEHAAEDLKQDAEIVLAAVRSDQAALAHAPGNLKKRKDFALAVVQSDGSALRHLPEEMKHDADIVLAAIRNHPSALLCGSEALQADRDFVMAAVKMNGFALRYALPEMKRNTRVVLAATIQNTHAFWYGSPELRHDQRFVQAAQKLAGCRNEAKRTASDEDQPVDVVGAGASACASATLVEEPDDLLTRICEELEAPPRASERPVPEAPPGPPDSMEFMNVEEEHVDATIAEMQAANGRLLNFTVLKTTNLGLSAWKRLLAAVPDTVEVINIQCSKLGDEGAGELASLLAAGRFPRLLTLWLLSNQVGPEGARVLAHGLGDPRRELAATSRSLRELWLFDDLTEANKELFRERLPRCDLEFDDLEFVQDDTAETEHQG